MRQLELFSSLLSINYTDYSLYIRYAYRYYVWGSKKVLKCNKNISMLLLFSFIICVCLNFLFDNIDL